MRARTNTLKAFMFLLAFGTLVHLMKIPTYRRYMVAAPAQSNREPNIPSSDLSEDRYVPNFKKLVHVDDSDNRNMKSELIQTDTKQKRNVTGLDQHSAGKGKFTIVLDPGRNILLYSAFLDLTNRSSPVIQVLSLIEAKTYPEGEDCSCVVHGIHDNGKMMMHISGFPSRLAPIGPTTALTVEGSNLRQGYNKRVVPCHFPERFLSWRDLRVGLKCGGKSDVRLPANSTVKVETPVFIPDEERMEFGVCVSVVYKHLDPYRLVEWLEMQRILGVGKIFIYNSSIGLQESRVLWDYQDEGFVELHQIPPVDRKLGGLAEIQGDINARQVLGLNDCMFRNMFQFKYMCGLDTDEFIMPQATFNLSSLLRAIQLELPPRLKSVPVGFYKFKTVNFLSEPGYDPRPDLSKPWYTHYLRYRWGLPVPRISMHPKIIFNPRVCKALFVHRCSYWQDPFIQVRVNVTAGFLNHHKIRHCRDGTTSDICSSAHLRTLYDGVLKYETLLVKRVTDRLHDLGMSTDTQPIYQLHKKVKDT